MPIPNKPYIYIYSKFFQRSYLHNGKFFDVETLLLFFNVPNKPYIQIIIDININPLKKISVENITDNGKFG